MSARAHAGATAVTSPAVQAVCPLSREQRVIAVRWAVQCVRAVAWVLGTSSQRKGLSTILPYPSGATAAKPSTIASVSSSSSSVLGANGVPGALPSAAAGHVLSMEAWSGTPSRAFPAMQACAPVNAPALGIRLTFTPASLQGWSQIEPAARRIAGSFVRTVLSLDHKSSTAAALWAASAQMSAGGRPVDVGSIPAFLAGRRAEQLFAGGVPSMETARRAVISATVLRRAAAEQMVGGLRNGQ